MMSYKCDRTVGIYSDPYCPNTLDMQSGLADMNGENPPPYQRYGMYIPL